MFKLEITDPKVASSVANGGEPLRNLCREEVENFDRFLRSQDDAQWRDGLIEYEKRVLEGYLYQKARGRLDG